MSRKAFLYRLYPSRSQARLLDATLETCRYLNKLAHNLTTRYDRIALEDLTITRMVHGNLAKSILDAGWGYLVQRLTHKAESAGRIVALVDPRYTSKTCSQCGHVFESLSLSDRWIDCACGLSLDRDHNAAINILKRAGQVGWGISSPVGGLPGVPSGPSRAVLTPAECHLPHAVEDQIAEGDTVVTR